MSRFALLFAALVWLAMAHPQGPSQRLSQEELHMQHHQHVLDEEIGAGDPLPLAAEMVRRKLVDRASLRG
jgi:hypothetical protein